MSDDATIQHTTGYKDDFKAEVRFDEPQECWHPTNGDLFEFLDLWFDSEDYEFGDGGYGRWWFWWYMTLIVMGYEDEAMEAYGLRGQEAVEHFEQSLDEHGTEIIDEVLRLQRGEKEGGTPRDERIPIRKPNHGDRE